MKMGAGYAGSKVYNDHHHFADDDIADIYEEAMYVGADLILTTQKDWTDVAPKAVTRHEMRFAYLEIELEMTAGEAEITHLIEDVLAGRICRE
jgi:tetraacyldisaccharide-1-P 4'-kinase